MSTFHFSILASAFCMFLACGPLAYADPNEALIHYYGFDIKRITGIHEEEIEKLGCPYTALSQDLERTLTKIDANESEYERRDVRAKIEMLGKFYFVDRFGFVRQGNEHFTLDKERFIASITPAGPCG